MLIGAESNYVHPRLADWTKAMSSRLDKCKEKGGNQLRREGPGSLTCSLPERNMPARDHEILAGRSSRPEGNIVRAKEMKP